MAPSGVTWGKLPQRFLRGRIFGLEIDGSYIAMIMTILVIACLLVQRSKASHIFVAVRSG